MSTFANAGYFTAVCGKNHYYDVDAPRHAFQLHGYEEAKLHEGLLRYDIRSSKFAGLVDHYGSEFNRSCPGCDPLATELVALQPASNASAGRAELTAPWRKVPGATLYNSARPFAYLYEEALHPTRWTADSAIDVIERWLARRRSGEQRALFLKTSFHRPHQPYDPPPRLLRSMLDQLDRIALPATSGHDGWDARYADGGVCTAAQRRYCGGACGFTAMCGRVRDRDARSIRAHYYASLAFVDEQAGRVLDRMRAAQEWRSTFVLYLSDHGDALGDHHLWRKVRVAGMACVWKAGRPSADGPRVPRRLASRRVSHTSRWRRSPCTCGGRSRSMRRWRCSAARWSRRWSS